MAVERQSIAEFAMISTLTQLQISGVGTWLKPASDNECRFRFKCSEAISELILFGRDSGNLIFLAFPESLESLILENNMKVYLNNDELVLWSLAVNRVIEVSFPMDRLVCKTSERELDLSVEGQASIQLCTYSSSRSADFDIKTSNKYPLFVSH